ncbi:hypothetical protein F3Y22_tig00112530pilonHSYRG00064 [Hibiscus syriacus]|uniref:Uncharacterized protein n=1 Tax=Hibiscus syriacus TaxID=106335 RepID=A0A6A2WW48_HIBSY|nr:hypothetical protein F3Y22_tig00112530pilonHSYRG00064 [Hibiscus syriacus]
MTAVSSDPVAFIATTEPCSDRSRGGSSLAFWRLLARAALVVATATAAWSLGYHNPRVSCCKTLDRWILPDPTVEIVWRLGMRWKP